MTSLPLLLIDASSIPAAASAITSSTTETQVLRLPNDVTRAFRQITPQVLREAVQGDALAQEIHRSYTAYLQNQLRWAEVADRAYWQARYA